MRYLCASVAWAAFTLAACGGGGGNAGPAPLPLPPGGTTGSGVLITPVSDPPPPAPPPLPDFDDPAKWETAEYKTNFGLDQIGASTAYAAGATGEGIKIAILDVGNQTNHPEVFGRVDPASTSIYAERGDAASVGGDNRWAHGLQVASLAMGSKNDVGAHGVAPGAELLYIRVDNGNSFPSVNNFPFHSPRDLAESIDYAVANGAKIISMSVAVSEDPTGILHDAIVRATGEGAVIVTALGNFFGNTPDNQKIITLLPAGFGSDPAFNGQLVLAGASSASGGIASFSPRAGNAADSFLLAPGANMLVPGTSGIILTPGNTTSFIRDSGTSFAAPHIAGALALLMSGFPGLDAPDALAILYDTAVDTGAPGLDSVTGAGRIDLRAAFAPIGPTKIALMGGQTPTSALLAAPGGAFGDWLWHSSLLAAAAMRDSYGRAFPVDPQSSAGRAQPLPLLAAHVAAAEVEIAAFSAGNFVAMLSSYAGNGDGRHAILGWSYIRNQGDSPPIASASFDFRSGAQFAQAGINRNAPALSRMAGVSALSAGLASSAFDLTSSRTWIRAGTQVGKWTIAALYGVGHGSGAAVALSRQFGTHDVSFELAAIRERGRTLGSYEGRRFGEEDGAEGTSAAISWRAPIGRGWRASARMEFARFENLRAFGSAEITENAVASAWHIGAERIVSHGLLGISLSQPLRVERGQIALPIETYSFAARRTQHVTRRANLMPSGRQVDVDISWRGTVADEMSLAAGMRLTRDYGHVAAASDAAAFWLQLGKSF